MTMGNENYTCIDKAELIELRRRAAFYEEPKQWEPPRGNYCLNGRGYIYTTTGKKHEEEHHDFGMAFTSMEQAEEAKPLIRSHNRLIRYVQEHGGIRPYLVDQDNWSVDLNNIQAVYYKFTQKIGVIYMTKECAESLAAGIKDGTVVL